MAALQLNNKTLRYITFQTFFLQVPILLWNANIYCVFIIICDWPAEAEHTPNSRSPDIKGNNTIS